MMNRENDINGNEFIICKLIHGDLVLDCKSRRVILAGKELKLTDTEFRLLFELVSNAGKVMEYTKLLHTLWGAKYKEEKNYLHTYVRYLRKKIELEPDNPRHIVNIPRVGYRFDCIQ